MDLQNDPRVFFAAERTLLAWLRTGLAVIGLGFVVARFGLFLRIVAGEHPEAALHLGSEWIGVSLVIVGSLSIAMGAWKHIRFCRTLTDKERPANYWVSTSVWFAVMLSILGGLLAGYVATTPIDARSIGKSAIESLAD
jgi:putative membrane protein